MSTRATVHFQQNRETKAIIYQHCDGYPNELGNDLRTFLRKLPKGARFNDPESLSARFVAWQSERPDVAIVLKDPECVEYRFLVHCDGNEVPVVEVESR